KPAWYFLIATALFSLVYWVLMPAWPLGKTYTKGLLGADVRKNVETSLQKAALDRARWTERIKKESFAAIQADEDLMKYVRETGRTLFGDNCAVCHGTKATGGPGFPSLVDNAWLWGGTPEDVFETIRVGINADHADSRIAQMMAFGRDEILDRKSILHVVAYVRSLSQPPTAGEQDTQETAAAQEIFATNCSSCHGDDAKGNKDMGAPDLTDSFWIYGGDEQSVYRTVYGGRQGHMP